MEDFKKELRTFGNLFFASYKDEKEATEKLKMFNETISENPELLPFITSEETRKMATTTIKVVSDKKMSTFDKALALGKLFK